MEARPRRTEARRPGPAVSSPRGPGESSRRSAAAPHECCGRVAPTARWAQASVGRGRGAETPREAGPPGQGRRGPGRGGREGLLPSSASSGAHNHKPRAPALLKVKIHPHGNSGLERTGRTERLPSRSTERQPAPSARTLQAQGGCAPHASVTSPPFPGSAAHVTHREALAQLPNSSHVAQHLTF